MRFTGSCSQLAWSIRTIFPLLFLLASAVTGRGACNSQSINSGDATGIVNVAFTYTITTTGNAQNYSATGLPPGLSIPNSSQPTISGTPTALGVYSVILTVQFTGNCTLNKAVTFTITNPNFVGFRLPDFQTSASSPNNPRLMLQMGANGTGTTANRFNATLEVDATGTGTWVPYNHFVGINTTSSWITDAPLPIRDSGALTGAPQAFGTAQLTQSPPAVYMKADPRATRFGIFQSDTNPTTSSRIVLSSWPGNSGTVPNGYGGSLGTDVEYIPLRFASGGTYYPATFSINNGVTANPTPPARYTQATSYSDSDGIVRLGDAVYADPFFTSTGSSTPYNTASYQPIILNRPLRNVAELGYAFRDLPWKTLDFFSDKSADAGLLDIFTINDGPQVLDGTTVVGMAPPTMAAGSVNLNTTQAPDLQAVFAGSILSEIGATTVNATGTGATDAPVLASQVVSATSTTPMQNKSELITRAGLPTTILPVPTPGAQPNPKQAVKTQREVVARAVSSVSQTRVWNVLIDVVAQSGRFKPNAGSLQNDFVVEGEQHYWVHVAIDRFTGRVIDKQIEVVNE
jgi:hypothetical protein